MRGLAEIGLNGRWPKIALNLMTVTLVAYFLASGAVALVVDPVLPNVGSGAGGSAKGAARVSVPPLNYFSPILSRNAFKAARPKPPAPKKEPVKPDIESLPIAKLNVALLGTIYSSVPALSRAVILEGSTQKLVKAGDDVSGFKISEIQRRAIVLEKGKVHQLLLIDKTDKTVAAKSDEARTMLPRASVKAVLQDLDALSKQIWLAPATRGKQQGLWVRDLRAGTMFSKAGLQKDDVILKVGGKSVTKNVNPVTLFKLLDNEQVVVDILRDGKPMQLVLILTG